MWALKHNGSTFTMDPGHSYGGAAHHSAFDVLKTNLDASFGGNRAPLPVFVHSTWFTPQRAADTNRFVQYALSLPHVYFVTVQTLLEWMRAPVGVDGMDDWLRSRCTPAAAAAAAAENTTGSPRAALAAPPPPPPPPASAGRRGAMATHRASLLKNMLARVSWRFRRRMLAPRGGGVAADTDV